MKVALVCDFLTKFGGAQQVLLGLHEAYPDAPIYCLLYSEKGTKGMFKDCQIVESNLKSQPNFLKKRIKFLLPKLPQAVEQFDFSDFDMVISSSDSYCHGIVTKPTTFHLCYCHTPMRYLWDWHNEYLRENKIGFDLKGMIVRSLIHKIRIWDKVAAERVDSWIGNSENVKKRIRKYYGKESTVIYPPVNTSEIKCADGKPENYYLIVSRLEPYKQIKLAVMAFNSLGIPLKIIGEGSEMAELKSIAKENIEFLGWQSNEAKYRYLENTKAFVFPGEDDFGITPVEAMAAGRPVVAYKKGGVPESVVDGETGIFFDEETPESLAAAVKEMETNYEKFSIRNCRKRAVEFSKESFINKVKDLADSEYKRYLNSLQK